MKHKHFSVRPRDRRQHLLFALALGVIAIFVPSCEDGKPAGGDSGVDPDASTAQGALIVIRNPGPGPAFLDGSYRTWCQTIFGLHRVDTEERLLLPNASLCRCEACDSTACTGMVSWWHFYIELPEGSELRYTWDRRYLGEPSPPASCGQTGCFGWLQASPGQHEVRVSYSRQTPVCAFGEEETVTADFLAPPGLALPLDAVLHQCVPEESNQCAQVPLSASARFDRDATGIEVVLGN